MALALHHCALTRSVAGSSTSIRVKPASRGARLSAHVRTCTSASATPPASASLPTPKEQVAKQAETLRNVFAEVDAITQTNVQRVLTVFRNARVGPHMFQGSTGYGHEDEGRIALDQMFAELVGAEAALVRPQFFSGTHTIACALFGTLRPGDELLALAGHPYDTLEEVIGLRGRKGDGSLAELNVSYREIALDAQGGLDWEAINKGVLKPNTKVVLIQRSRGYAMRPTLEVAEIGRAVAALKKERPGIAVFVDNCYGEFTEVIEPTAVGADLIMGSLIKNPGGTIVPCGGYVAGKEEYVANASARLSAPGIGIDAGATVGEWRASLLDTRALRPCNPLPTGRRLLMQGLFLGPGMVGEAVKGSHLIAATMAAEGFVTAPVPGEPRHDVITSVVLRSPKRQVAFCQAVQKACPIGAYIQPEPAATPGYASDIIFANGTFIEGSTAELSADGPLREPFVVYCQGGTHWTHWAIALESAVDALRKLPSDAEEQQAAEEEAKRKAAAAAAAGSRR